MAFDNEKVVGNASVAGAVYDANSDSGSSLDKKVHYRTLSWQKTAALLFAEYICLAILAFPYSFSVLGMAGGILTTLVITIFVLYTSMVLWQFCLRHPEVRDVCDIGKMLFGGSNVAYYLTAIIMILNNVFICALHVLTGAKYLNTITNHATCTVVFSVVTAIIIFFFSLPRTFSQLTSMSVFSAACMFIAVLLCIIFHGIQDHPAGYPKFGEPTWGSGAPKGTTFIDGFNAMLNISFTLIGQITLPSFIADMKNPEDFPKALYAVTIAELILFCLAGGIVYFYVGAEYVAAPAFGSLQPLYKKIAFSFAIPTIIVIGVIYSYVTSRFIFTRVLGKTRHYESNGFTAWASWTGITAAIWVAAFIVSEIIPFFGDLLSLMSSLFDGWFGFIFWGLAWLQMNKGRWFAGPGQMIQFAFNIILILIGLLMFGVGTWTSIEAILADYKVGAVRSPFTCASNGI